MTFECRIATDTDNWLRSQFHIALFFTRKTLFPL